jgi:hypothetical protein
VTDVPWLTVLGLVPLVGALVVAALPSGRDALAKQVALLVSLVVLGLTIVMCAAFDPDGDRFQFVQAYDWIPAFGVQYAVGADGIALVLIALIAVLVPVVVLASWYDADPQADPLAAAAAVGARAAGGALDDGGWTTEHGAGRPAAAWAGERPAPRSSTRRPSRRRPSRSTTCRRDAASRRSSRSCCCSRR